MFALPDRGRCQCVRAEIVCAKSPSGMVHKPGMFRDIHFSLTFSYEVILFMSLSS